MLNWRVRLERRPDAGPLTAQDWGKAVVAGLLTAMWAFAVLMVVVKVAGGRVGWGWLGSSARRG